MSTYITLCIQRVHSNVSEYERVQLQGAYDNDDDYDYDGAGRDDYEDDN